MINVQAVVLKLLLSCTDKDLALSAFEQIKPHFFSTAYGTLHKAIAQYYSEHGKIPNIDELAIKFSRNTGLQMALAALNQLNTLDIDIDIACDALRNEYAQQEALTLINDHLLNDVTLLTADDIVDRLYTLPMKLEEKIESSGKIMTASQIQIFCPEESIKADTIYTGISNVWDGEYGGTLRQDLIFLGGGMGSGKSVFCANLCVNQYRARKIAPYYTIEMTGRETLQRMLSIMAGVDAMKLKQQRLEGDELQKLALTRSQMFHGGEEAYYEFIRNKGEMRFSDFTDLDLKLMKNHEEVHPLIIVDDPDLRMSTIDVSLSKLKAQYGNDLTLGVVDYVNQVRLDTGDHYAWDYQINLANNLKGLARKHDVAIFSPYQMNEDGSARFSKGILVPVDVALMLNADHNTGIINLNAAKVRSLPPCEFNVAIDWKTLTIDPTEITNEEAEQAKEEAANAKNVEKAMEHKETKQGEDVERFEI